MSSFPVNLVVALVMAIGLLPGCGRSAGKQNGEAAASPAGGAAGDAASASASDRSSRSADPVVILRTTQGDITVQLFAEKAPRTVENFLQAYAERGFYDQTIFHHVQRGKMLIGGGYTASFERKPSRAPIYNESGNGLSNRRGTVAMIREPDSPHSATCEFFVNLADNTDFDFQAAEPDDVPGYCVFGEVISGMDVVDRIAQLPTAEQGAFPNVPSPAVSIVSIRRLH